MEISFAEELICNVLNGAYVDAEYNYGIIQYILHNNYSIIRNKKIKNIVYSVLYKFNNWKEIAKIAGIDTRNHKTTIVILQHSKNCYYQSYNEYKNLIDIILQAKVYILVDIINQIVWRNYNYLIKYLLEKTECSIKLLAIILHSNLSEKILHVIMPKMDDIMFSELYYFIIHHDTLILNPYIIIDDYMYSRLINKHGDINIKLKRNFIQMYEIHGINFNDYINSNNMTHIITECFGDECFISCLYYKVMKYYKITKDIIPKNNTHDEILYLMNNHNCYSHTYYDILKKIDINPIKPKDLKLYYYKMLSRNIIPYLMGYKYDNNNDIIEYMYNKYDCRDTIDDIVSYYNNI